MNFDEVTCLVKFNGDEYDFASAAFKRAAAVCRQGNISSHNELKSFLNSERDECLRRANWEAKMTKYYHENAEVSYKMEAQAFELMLSRLG